MASRRADSNAWIQGLGENIGVELGKVIAASLQRTLEGSVDLDGVARRMGARIKPGGKRAAAAGGCSVAGCPNPVLAKGLCRSHYYKARYLSKKPAAKAVRVAKK